MKTIAFVLLLIGAPDTRGNPCKTSPDLVLSVSAQINGSTTQFKRIGAHFKKPLVVTVGEFRVTIRFLRFKKCILVMLTILKGSEVIDEPEMVCPLMGGSVTCKLFPYPPALGSMTSPLAHAEITPQDVRAELSIRVKPRK